MRVCLHSSLIILCIGILLIYMLVRSTCKPLVDRSGGVTFSLSMSIARFCDLDLGIFSSEKKALPSPSSNVN